MSIHRYKLLSKYTLYNKLDPLSDTDLEIVNTFLIKYALSNLWESSTTVSPCQSTDNETIYYSLKYKNNYSDGYIIFNKDNADDGVLSDWWSNYPTHDIATNFTLLCDAPSKFTNNIIRTLARAIKELNNYTI